MNRRCFLSGAAAFAASRPWRLFAETGESQPMALDVAGATPDLRFGVVSDVHVREATGQYGTDGLAHTITRSRRNRSATRAARSRPTGISCSEMGQPTGIGRDYLFSMRQTGTLMSPSAVR